MIKIWWKKEVRERELRKMSKSRWEMEIDKEWKRKWVRHREREGERGRDRQGGRERQRQKTNRERKRNRAQIVRVKKGTGEILWFWLSVETRENPLKILEHQYFFPLLLLFLSFTHFPSLFRFLFHFLLACTNIAS